MTYWTQIATYPSLLIGPGIIAAIVAAIAGLITSYLTRSATSGDVDRKIASERALTDAKFLHEKEESLTERAWADYGLRRDIYLDLAAQIGCLFGSGATSTASIADTAKFHETTRKVRLIGSDAVVTALNNMTAAVKNGAAPAVTSAAYSELMNSIRVDIRTLNEKPPVGTTLNAKDFPIER